MYYVKQKAPYKHPNNELPSSKCILTSYSYNEYITAD